MRATAIGLIVCGTLCVGALLVLWILPVQPTIETQARIIGIFANQSKYSISYDIVFRSSDGVTGYEMLPADQLGCRVGDLVAAHRAGISLYVDPGICRRQMTSPWGVTGSHS